MAHDHPWHIDLIEPPKQLLKPLQLPVKTLTGPGPTNCTDRTLRSLQHQVIGHFHTEIFQLMDEIKLGIQYVFQTKNRLTLAVSASGHGGMEACLGNLLEPGETVLIVKSGFWGVRAGDICNRIGAYVQYLELELGIGFELDLLETALKKHKPTVVFVTHGESSTGLLQPLEGVGDLVHKYNALLLVDGVASFGGVPFFMDAWSIDAAYTGSQKVLGAPPGLSPLSFSPRAEKKLFARRTKVPVFYWDLTVLGQYWNCFGNQRLYHHTISATLVYGLREALSQLAEEGLANSWARHTEAGIKLREGLKVRGLSILVKDPRYQLCTVTAITIPPGIDWKLVSTRAMERYHVEVAGGLGATAGKVMRIGLLGPNAMPRTVDLLLAVLDDALEYVYVTLVVHSSGTRLVLLFLTHRVCPGMPFQWTNL